jgi:hypothetical protein
MKKLLVLISYNIHINMHLCIAILILISFSCKKEEDDDLKINFKFYTNEIIYYPDKHISVTFDIFPEGNNAPYKLKWFVPDSLKEEGPYAIKITGNIILDFEIIDVKNTSKRFTYEIKTDTLDSLKYDYRNNYIGKYSCNVNSSYNGSTNRYKDTITVVKNGSFSILNIQTKSDILNHYEGNKMTYLNSSGYYNYPAGEFYGYHSGASFSNDSIHYTVSGPLGFYYTNIYEGIRINQ